MWEVAKTCGEIPLVFEKRLKYVGNDLENWEMGKLFGKCLRYMGHGFSI